MKQMIQHALSSAKMVCVDYGDPLPESVFNILRTNQSEFHLPSEENHVFFSDMNRIHLMKCCLPTAEMLFTNRRFDFIKVDSSVFTHIHDVSIRTEELEIDGMSLKEVLKINSIETRSLLCNYSNEKFQDSFLNMNPGWLFLPLIYSN